MKIVSAIVLLALAAAGAWYYQAPRSAVEGLRAAAAEGDAARLERYVDFAALRDHLKNDLKAAMLSGTRGASDHPLAAIGILLGGAVVDRAVDALISPTSIAALARGHLPTDEESGQTARDYRIDRQGLNRFTVSFDEGRSPALHFERRGLRWELTRIAISR